MYIVIWWDAKGDCQQPEEMPKARALIFAGSMNEEQEACLMYVNKE